jgi:ketosteroid isomerase-like protein
MKSGRLIPALALVLAVAACQPPAETPSTTEAEPTFTAEDETAIRGMLEEFVADVIAEDWAAHVSYYAVDAVRMPPNEPMMQGHAAITEWFEAFPPITGFTLTPQVVAGDGDLAYARGAYTLDLAPPDAEPVSMVGKWHAIYGRQADGSWLCVSDIWNTDMPMAM